MRKALSPAAAALLLFWSLGLAVWAFIVWRSSAVSLADHALGLRLLPFLLIWTLAYLLLLGLTLAWDRDASAFDLFPLAFFFLAPLALANTLTRSDLRTRLGLLAVFVAVAVIFLRAVRPKEKPPLRRRLEKLEARFSALSRRRKCVLLFAAAMAVYLAGAGILVSQGITFYGDEPHYLMTSHSLLKDGDINLADNFAARDYFHFYDKAQDPRLRLNPHGHAGIKDPSSIYPINLPGISVLMLPFYALSFLFKGQLLAWLLRIGLAPWAALLGVQFFLLAMETWKRERLALGLWAVYAFTSPVLFFAVHLYPEIPIACFSLFVFRKVYSPARLSSGQAWLCGFLLALFPWFGLKYVFILGPLVLIAAYGLWKMKRAPGRLLPVAGLPALSLALFFLFLHSLYGTWSPASVYKGAMTAERAAEVQQDYLSIPLSMRTDTLWNYVLDQRDGLLPYAPFYAFALLGAIILFRRNKRDLAVLLLAAAPYVLSMAALTERGGFSPPARPLAPVSWVLMVMVGHFAAENRRSWWSSLWKASAAAALVMAGLLLAHPYFLYQTTTHDSIVRPADMFVFLGHLGFFLPAYLPSFIKYPNEGHAPNLFWIAALAAFVLAYFFIKPFKIRPPRGLARGAGVALALGAAFWLWVLYPRSALYNHRAAGYGRGQTIAFYLFPAGRGVVYQPPGDLYLHYEKTYKFPVRTTAPLAGLRLEFGSPKGTYDVAVRLNDRILFEGRIERRMTAAVAPGPASYALGPHRLYEVDITVKKRSAENMLIDPFLLRIVPAPAGL